MCSWRIRRCRQVFWLVVLGMVSWLLAPGTAAAQGSLSPEKVLGKLVLNKTDKGGGVQAKSEGTITLFFEKGSRKPQTFRGAGRSTTSAAGVGMTTSEAMKGQFKYNSSGIPTVLVVTQWSRGRGISVELPKSGFPIPLVDAATIHSISTVQYEEIEVICESDITVEIEDECIDLWTLLHLVQTLLEAYQKTPPREGETWNDYKQRVVASMRENLLKDTRQILDQMSAEGLAKLQADSPQVKVLLAETTITSAAPAFGGEPPISIDWGIASEYGSKQSGDLVNSLKQRHAKADIPDRAWRAVEQAIGDAEDLWGQINGADDPPSRRVFEESYLKGLGEQIKKAIEEVCPF